MSNDDLVKLEEFEGKLINKNDIKILNDLKDNFDKYMRVLDKKEEISSYYSTGFIISDNNVDGLVLHGSFDSKEIPSSIGAFKHLTRLSIANISNIPEEIEQLVFLKELSVTNCKNIDIPDEICNLTSLKKLDLSNNELKYLPDAFGKLGNLEELNLEGNKLSKLPTSFKELKNLKILNLANQGHRFKREKGKSLSNFPKVICELTNLEELYLENNGIYFIPDEIEKLKRLITLNLNKNLLTYLPDAFGWFHNIETLILDHNEISRLPERMSGLTNLRKILLNNNKLRKLANLENFHNLEILKLHTNELEELPESLWALPNLKELDFSNNNVKFLSEKIVNLKKLEHLSFDDNPKISLPANLELLFAKDKLYARLCSKAGKIPPNLLLSQDKGFRRQIIDCFYNSFNQLENLEEYVLSYIIGNPKIKKYLLKFGIKLIKPIQILLKKTYYEEKIELLNDLLEEVEDRQRKSNIRIHFINLMETEGSKSYPMGIMYLSAYLKEHNFSNIHYIDYFCFIRALASGSEEFRHRWTVDEFGRREREQLENEFYSKLIEVRPYIILIGPTTTPNLIEVVELIPKLRKILPDSIILAGGPHFNKSQQLDTEFLNVHCKEIDGIIIGEAEDTILDLVNLYYEYSILSTTQEIRENVLANLENIMGIRVRNKAHAERCDPKLNHLPFPDFDLIEEYLKQKPYHSFKYSLCERRDPFVGFYEGVVDDAYGGGYYSEDKFYFDVYKGSNKNIPFGVIVGSRGCPYNCAFCNSPGNRRVHTAQYMYNLMEELYYRFDVRLFVFFDPLFTSAAKSEMNRIDEFCDLLLKSNYDFKFLIEIRADVIKKLPMEFLTKLIQSGCAQFNLGLEKGYDEGLEIITKNITTKDHHDAILKIRQASQNIRSEVLINGTFILGGPEETKEHVFQTIKHALLLDLDGVIFFPFEIHPGTELYERAIKDGVIKSGLNIYLDKSKYPKYATDLLSREYLEKMGTITKNFITGALRDLRNEIFKFEEQFILVDDTIIENYQLGDLRIKLRDFMIKFSNEIKTPPDSSKFNEIDFSSYLDIISEPLEKLFLELENQIQIKITNYDPHVGDYYLGTLQSILTNLKKEIIDFFKQLLY